MIYRWVPEKPLEGFIEVELPGYDDRLKLLEKLNVKISGSGQVEFGSGSRLEELRLGKEEVYSRIKSFELRYGEKEFKTLSELECFSEFSEVLNSLVFLVFNGVSLGNVFGKVSKSKLSGHLKESA